LGAQPFRILALILALFLAADLINNARRWRFSRKNGSPPRFPKLFIGFYFLPQAAFVVVLLSASIQRVTLSLYTASLVWLLFPCAAQMLSFARNAEREITDQRKAA
jgi:hypothetical protein